MTRDVNDVMHRKRARRILGILKKSVSWVLPRKKKVDFRLLVEALWRVRTWWGADGKVSIERLCLSPYVEKPFNSKVIKKSFVPERRSRKCFRISGFLCSMYICYEHSMYVSHIHVWVCYTSPLLLIVLLNSIQCPHRADECKSLLVV